MRKPRRIRIAALLTISLVIATTANSEPLALKADATRHWYRGNMHTHSLWSDGNDYLEMIAWWYREHGYQFVVFTDHNVLAEGERWIDVEESDGGRPAYEAFKARFPRFVKERTSPEGRLEVRLSTFYEAASRMNEDGKFLLIQGEEISDRSERVPVHLNVTNLREVMLPLRRPTISETIQDNVRAAHAQQQQSNEPVLMHLNHPNFGYAINAEDMLTIRNCRFFELYNGHPSVRNNGDDQRASTERIWDIVLTRRLAELGLPIVYGLAVDDSHNSYNFTERGEGLRKMSYPGRGWVMILAEELTASSLLDSLKAGHFYASTGVTLNSIVATTETISIEVEPLAGETYEIEFVGTRRGYDASHEPVLDEEGKEIDTTRRYSSDIGTTLATVSGDRALYRLQGDEIYVRARVTSSAKHPTDVEGNFKRAWTQPIVVPGGRPSLQE